MFDTRSELLEKIRLGEDSYLELKELRFAGARVKGPTQNDLADELAAFANRAGGVLLLGVEDKRRIVAGIAVERLEAVEALLRQACEDAIKPALAPLIERLTLPDATGIEQPVIRVDVARSLFVHQSPGGYLHRVGSSKRPIPPEQLARLFQQRSQSRLIRFDETLIPAATFADLDEVLWRRFTARPVSARCGGHLRAAGPADCGRLSLRAQEHANLGQKGPARRPGRHAAIRPAGCVRSRHQRRGPPGLFVGGQQGALAVVQRPAGDLHARHAGQHHDAGNAALSTGLPQ